ncbi:helix-turn-helix domain-containing protein [Actinacidiphila paucisporea]|uniref:Helix-turn-helix domain-containing protein n=1 Tax=Actinacidiphila paucisporea TaxID=310782 RepID=A0A1M6U4Q4_9ACTN|nr:helix-turn-helix transcriptional regulator [Actinacidiphila paucisporea]SHK64143.1 Helix-turn-helix domain-containing protein [Actinacidiphila paucisporea]
MGQWEPLADRIPLDMRRLATQLRRMKDRSGLTVPALAARTAESADAWAGYLAAAKVPPLAAVEVLAQACGADYDRVGALWKLAEKASTGTGDRGRDKPVPQPDPLDPLSAQDAMPARRRRFLLLAAAGVLAVAALLAVVLMAGTSNGRAPGGDADSPGKGGTASGAPLPSAPPRGRTPAAQDPGGPGGADTSSGAPVDTAAAVPPAPGPATPAAPAATATSAPPSGTPVPTAPGTTTSAAPSATPTATATPSATPSPTHTGLCLGLILLGVCVG